MEGLQTLNLIDFGLEFIPRRSHTDIPDAGADVYAHQGYTIQPHETIAIPLRFGVELPAGYAGYIQPRSSLAKRGLIANMVPIDAGYRGEIHAIIVNNSNRVQTIFYGERVAQLVIVPIVTPNLKVITCEEASKTDRGAGAFGSTGK